MGGVVPGGCVELQPIQVRGACGPNQRRHTTGSLRTLVFAAEGSRIKRHWIRWEWPSSGAAPRTPSADVPSRPVLREVAWAAGSPPEMDGPLLHVAAALPWGGGADPRSRLEWRGAARPRREGARP